MTATSVSLVLPASNQADHIRDVVEGYEAALARLGPAREILIVVNGPADATLGAARELERELESVAVLHSERRGWGRAVRMGVRASQGDLVCYTNSARTSASDLASHIGLAMENPGSVVKANRKVRESWKRRLGSLLYNLECRSLFDLSYWDINGTPKVFPRAFDRLLALEREDDLIDLEFAVVCREEGYPVLEVPVFSTRRHGGRSTTNYTSAFRMYWGAFEMWRSRRGASVPGRRATAT
jgi:glycosyltransferase involved in cell wall biosynthesis